MLNDDFSKILNAQANLRRQLEPLFEALEAYTKLHSTIPWQQVIVENQDLQRSFFGLLEDIRRSGLMDIESKTLNMTSVFQRLLEAEQSFVVPNTSITASLFSDFSNTHHVEHFSLYSQHISNLQQFVESIRAPWLDQMNQIQSLSGLAGLYGIGSLLRTLPPYDTELTETLRLDLGDWRKEITWTPDVANDPSTRASLYDRQGFKSALTKFPNSAFEEIVIKAGVKRPEIPLVLEYDLHRNSQEDECAFERTNNAYAILHNFETQLRNFINEGMGNTFGLNWIKHRVPADIRSRWRSRQDRDAKGEKWPVICYADFADYVVIITKNDNWRDLFKATFVNKCSVQESFRRVTPIRLAVMHARAITQDDELLLYVETNRILSAIDLNL